MRIGNLEINLHRTVRVADGRSPSNLPPSLGRMVTYKVADYADKVPADWDGNAIFVALHDTEALWLSFHPLGNPVALLVGAGGINAVNGEKLGTKLEKDNYLVAPPQPWLDGWKNEDGSVYQFVATPYQKGEGKTVAEQLIGAESKSGALGIAVFDPKDAGSLKKSGKLAQGYTGSAFGSDFAYVAGSSIWSDPISEAECSAAPKAKGISGQSVTRSASLGEMGVGKGGKITQKIYPDPHGLDVWQDSPSAAIAIYLVNAEAFAEITGQSIPKPVDHLQYGGNWFGLQDAGQSDVAGTSKFAGLKSAFVGDTENVKAD